MNADSVSADTARRLFNRLEALERGVVGTADQPGLVAKLEIARREIDGKIDRLADKVGINNWLTGSIALILVGQILLNFFQR